MGRTVGCCRRKAVRPLQNMDGATTMTKTDQLTRALIDAAAKGLRPHCSDAGSHHLWLSDHEADRAIAVRLCRHCPVETVCRDTAEQRDERWGVWGGVDRSIRPGRPKKAA
jgi:Transcription factor WhiB